MSNKLIRFTTLFFVILTGIVSIIASDDTAGPVIGNALEQLGFNERLAYRWAPIHTQDVDQTGTHSLGGKSDYITNIDYDGDWNTRNNWEHAGDYPLKAYAYYSVVSTSTHWYIVYAFYHPRDWAEELIVSRITEHENDLEGFLAIVRRPPVFAMNDFGKLEGIVTVFHNDFYSYTPAGSPLRDGNENIDGLLKMETYDGNDHPKTAQQARGHGLKAKPYVKIEGGDGIFYFPSGFAQEPSNPNDRNVGYKLLNIFMHDGMWDHRTDPFTFASYGSFAGDDGKDNAAHAPWAWDDKDDGSSLQGGELAVDPAKLVNVYFTGLGTFSTTYRFNEYTGDYCNWPNDC